MGIEEGTCWYEHWVLCGNQFGNTFHIKKNCTAKKKKSHEQTNVKNYKQGTILTSQVRRFAYLVTEIIEKQGQITTCEAAKALDTNGYFTKKMFLKHIKEC